MNLEELAGRIYRESHLHGDFLLRSGARSGEYFDKYLFEANPEILSQVAEKMCNLLPKSFDALAGLELGGIPIATMMAHFSGKKVFFVRKKAKDYGTCRLAEGGDVEGRELVSIEDVVSSGGAILEAVTELRKLNANVKTVLCVIDRESGGKEKLSAQGLALLSLFTKTQLEKWAVA